MHKNLFLEEKKKAKSWFVLVARCAADAGKHNHPATPTQRGPGRKLAQHSDRKRSAHFLALLHPVAVTPSVTTSPSIHIWRRDKRRNEKPAAGRPPPLDSARFLRV